MDFEGKKILITQPMMHWICGSTVVTLELAEYFQSKGAMVVVYTCFYDEPIKGICEKKKIRVDKYSDSLDYRLEDFDIVWVHSQVLPLSLVRALGKKMPKKMPAFVFLHMSGMDWIPDEKPWIFDLENRLSSLSLFISEEVKMVNDDMLNGKIKKGYFRNPAPTAFQEREKRPQEKLQNLLIVSNHPPKEVLEAKDILTRDYGINVEMLGEGQKKYELIDFEKIEQVDAVLTIAKTVQYCLISGTPAYVYDEFGGGVGWLNDENFEGAKRRNFSGYQNRFYPDYEGGGFEKKSARKIAKEIVEGYGDALAYQTKNRESFLNDFAIERALPRSLKGLEARNDIEIFKKGYLGSVLAAQSFAEKRFEASSIAYNLRHTNEDIREVLSSKPYRLCRKLTRPYAKIKQIRWKHR